VLLLFRAARCLPREKVAALKAHKERERKSEKIKEPVRTHADKKNERRRRGRKGEKRPWDGGFYEIIHGKLKMVL
jgi:hypothetical protein